MTKKELVSGGMGKKFFDILYGENAKNESHAKRLLARAKQLSFMQV